MEEPRSIGETLRQRRGERGLSVEEASAQSKVPLRLFQALESDDYRLLPDPLYLIRFLHDYARFLGLDAHAMEAEFKRAVRHPPRVPVAPASTAPTPPAIPWKQLAWTAAAILVVTPLVFIALSLASKRAAERTQVPVAEQQPEKEAQAPRPPEAGAPLSTPGEGQPADAPTMPWPEGGSAAAPHSPGIPLSSLDGGQTPSASAAPGSGMAEPSVPPAEEPSAPVPVKQVLVARARELTWMVVRADGGEPREVLLQAGQTARFTADAKFIVTLGNAGGVTLSLNGVPIPPLGRSGQVIRDFTLPQGGPPPTGEAAAPPPSRSGR